MKPSPQNKPDPTNGEEKMREMWKEHADTNCGNISARYDKQIADYWLAQLKQSHLALLEQMIGEMPKKEKITKKELNDPIAYYKTGRNETIDLINTDLRTKIEELKKQQP